MTKVLDLPKARRLAQKAVAAKGAEHVQSVCYYVTEDRENIYTGRVEEQSWRGESNPKPGCIVGTILWYFDKDAILDAAANGANGNLITDDAVLNGLAEKGVRITRPALAFLNHAQEGQDGRHDEGYNHLPWGQAVSRALNKIAK